MKATTRNVTLVVLTLVSALFSRGRASAHGDCREVKGKLVDVYPGTGNKTMGVITNAGLLRGTTETVYDSAALPTPDPTTVSYTGDLTITTSRGQLKTRNVYLYDFGTGLFTVMGRINPAISTGRFAGATGVLFLSGSTIGDGFTYQAGVTGELCLADK